MGVYLKIKEERKKKQMTQEQLAEKVGVSIKTIAKWENDAAMPTLENCKKLRSVFEVTLDYLLEDSFELQDTYDEYVRLGEKVLELADEEYPLDFIQNYYICAREPSLVIPKKVADSFIKNIGEKINNTDYFDSEKIKMIHQEIKDFLYFWYKYNKGKYLLSKNLKAKTLFMNSISFTSEEITNQLKNPETQTKPILLLRNLMINRLIEECNLLQYNIDEEIEEELDYSGEIMWPLSTYN
ncbi:helix-turn-helix domain-containing protein [Candidatus Enterococcus lemimoniae]|uniref:HTH cro/C1-type domain-containing protein n=1 Tax=Candidatus Enterococcus lemimoniae TaxID=1834167 RepID=A0ABZ2T8F8_9ENTE|nr:helix-turn-helix transcriptional regulator [Enterococcus sp. 12C11_DIV0727]OTO68897.1 hypothetical protein A5866_001096 [Enterococcus sp. 12C11_DIV0727]